MKKLNLNKEVIATLNDDNMNHIVGGEEIMWTSIAPGLCEFSCGVDCDSRNMCHSLVICIEEHKVGLTLPI